MITARTDEIEQKAQQVLGDYLGDPATISLPINIATILQKNDIKLFSADFENKTVAGAYLKDKKEIYVSADDRKTRQLFTVAHELGHYFLHPDKSTDIFYRHKADEFDVEDVTDEQEANLFAANLVMPKELMKKVWNEEKDVELLAARFGVSYSAASWRLKNLNLYNS